MDTQEQRNQVQVQFQFRQSIGEFLCIHPRIDPVELMDRPSPLDVKQEAAIGAVVGLRKLGKDAPCDELVATFDAEPRIAAQAYRWAYHDALRKQLGRGKQPRLTVVRSSQLTGGDRYDPPGSPDGRTNRDPIDALRDPTQEEALTAVEDDHAGELQRLWDEGIEGLTVDQTRRVVRLMRHVQQMKVQGITRIPDDIRQQLSRLRKETGLPLSTALL